MAEVRVEHLVKAYGPRARFDDVTLTFPDGQFFGLLALLAAQDDALRAIAGFVQPDSGRVFIGEQPVEAVPVEGREIGNGCSRTTPSFPT